MRIAISFTRELTLAAISSIGRYYETLESQMQLANVEEFQRVKERIQNMRLNEEQKREEWDIAQQGHEMDFGMLFPNFLRYSCMVLLYLIIENKLGEISKAAHQKCKLPGSPPKPSREIIKKYKKYFIEKVGIQGLQWDVLHNLNMVRNCIVHASGKVKGRGDDKEKELRELATTVRGVSISEGDFRNDLRPLYLEKDMLMLTPEYCQMTIKDVYRFFEQLYDAIPSPSFSDQARE